MGAGCSGACYQRRREHSARLANTSYTRFPSKHSVPQCQVIMQLTGEGLVDVSESSFYAFRDDQHVSIRYHYQYQCMFAPNDDSSLIYGAVVNQINMTFPFQRKPQFGSYLRVWNLSTSETTTTTRVFTVTSGPWSVSPNGRSLCCQAARDYREDDIFFSSCDAGCQQCITCEFSGVMTERRRLYPQACPFSPDGTMIASAFENNTGLLLLIIQPGSLNVMHSVKIRKQCKGFEGTIVSCVFSTDSAYIAIISSRGQIFILRSAGLKVIHFLDTAKDLESLERFDEARSEPCVCDFDPRLPHHVFATCSFYRGLVKIWQIREWEKNSVRSICEVEFSRALNMIKYSPDGALLAVAGSEGMISCLNPDDGETLFELNTSAQPQMFWSTAGIYHLAFSRGRGQLAASYSDGYIRIWQLPVNINLQHLCRLTINEAVPSNKIHLLPIPLKMRNYLIYKTYCDKP